MSKKQQKAHKNVVRKSNYNLQLADPDGSLRVFIESMIAQSPFLLNDEKTLSGFCRMIIKRADLVLDKVGSERVVVSKSPANV